MIVRNWIIALALGAALAGCGVPKEEHQKVVEAMRKLEGDFAKMKTRAEKGEEQASVYKGQLEALGQDMSKLKEGQEMTSAELELARKRMDELRRQQDANEVRISQYRKLVDKLKTMVAEGKIQLRARNGRLTVRLPDEILFPPGKADLKQEGRDALFQLGAALREIDDRDFQIAGHTDNVPIKSKKFKSNWELSQARALVVLQILMEAGMDPRHLSAAGFADMAPVTDNSTDDGRKQNRRIEIVLEPNIKELPSIDEVLKPIPTKRTTGPQGS